MSGDQLFWVIVATAVTIVLKWASNRWPGTPDPRRKRNRRTDDELEDEA